jgi:hypothetical protein
MHVHRRPIAKERSFEAQTFPENGIEDRINILEV